MNLDPRHVRVFREVVRTGSYSGAARALGYSQPAVSQQMRGLERSLGTPLFVRLGRRMQLTEAGDTLLSHSKAILDGLAVAEAQVRAIAGLEHGSVRIAAFPSANATLIPSMISLLLERTPGVKVSLIEAEPPDSLQLLRNAACDVAVAFGHERSSGGGLLGVPLITDELVVLSPRHLVEGDSGRRPIEAFATHRWIAGCPQCSENFIDICNRAGFDPEIVCATDDNLSVQSLVAAGLGSALMPELAVSFMQHPDIEVVRLDPAPKRSIVAYTWPRLERVPAVNAVIKSLRDVSAIHARGWEPHSRSAEARQASPTLPGRE